MTDTTLDGSLAQPPGQARTAMRPLLSVSWVLLALHAYISLRGPVSPWIALPAIPQTAQVEAVTLLLLALCHGTALLGSRLSLSFFAICAVVSWLFEQTGVGTGWVYGPYHYSSMLGFKLGFVPLIIPCAWFAVAYPSHLLANLIVDRRLVSPRSTWLRLLWLSAIAAMIMTAWDLPMDPQMSRDGNWIWEQVGPYFGVPLRNYAGWLATTFTVYALYRALERARPPRQPPDSLELRALPIAQYGLLALSYILASEPAALRLVALFAMGLPTLLALGAVAGLGRSPRS